MVIDFGSRVGPHSTCLQSFQMKVNWTQEDSQRKIALTSLRHTHLQSPSIKGILSGCGSTLSSVNNPQEEPQTSHWGASITVASFFIPGSIFTPVPGTRCSYVPFGSSLCTCFRHKPHSLHKYLMGTGTVSMIGIILNPGNIEVNIVDNVCMAMIVKGETNKQQESQNIYLNFRSGKSYEDK